MNSPKHNNNKTKLKKLKNSTSNNGGAWHQRDPQEDAPKLMKKNKSKKEKTIFGARSRNTS
jgi:hypothetical protein